MNRRHWAIFSTGILLFGAAWIGVSRVPPTQSTIVEQAIPRVGFRAPDFTLGTTQGESITLSDLIGQPVVLNLWASWCPPCRAEMPALEKVFGDYAEQGLFILAINATSQDDLDSAKGFVQDLTLTFPILLDSTGEVSRLYDLRSLPTTFFIDHRGVIQEVVIGGPMAEALLRIRVERLLEAATP